MLPTLLTVQLKKWCKRTFFSLLALMVSCSSTLAATQSVDIAVFEDHDKYVDAAIGYGLSWKLLSLAAADQDIAFVTQPSAWSAAIKRVQAHRVSLVFGAFKTKEREAWANFTYPLYAEGSAIFTSPSNKVNTISDIDVVNSTIGVSSHSVQETMAKNIGFENIYSSRARTRLYTLLDEGRLDYLLFGQSIVSYYCLNHAKRKQRHCMKQVGDVIMPDWVRALADNQNPEAVEAIRKLNQGLRNIKDTEKAYQLFLSYGLNDSDYQRWLEMLNSTISEN